MISNQEFLVKDIPSTDSLRSKILNYRQREKLLDKWLVKRLDSILPQVMKEAGIDCWVLINNEYNEDPIFWTLTTYNQITARRLTIMVFRLNKDGSVSRYSVTRYPMDNYKQLWNDQSISQMKTLADTIKSWKVNKIGLNFSDDFAYADGLSYSLYRDFVKELDEEEKAKIVSAENIVVGWLETRSEEEMVAYNDIVQIAHTMIAEAYSNKVIHPGVTSADDVKYWMMQKAEISTKHISDILKVANPLSKRRLVAQRIVIECIHALDKEQLARLESVLHDIALNPNISTIQ